MGKVKPYSRRRLKRLRKAWIRRNARLVAVLCIGLVVLLLLASALLLFVGQRSPMDWYLLGAIHAGFIASGLHLVNSAFFATDQEAIRQLRGAWGEENTRSELERAKRKGLIWGWVDSVTLAAGDIDHLVVTRSGGLVAIDTKWRDSADGGRQVKMARDAHKVRLRAEGVLRSVLARGSGDHRARSNPLEVTPVIVVWGPLQHHLPAGARVDEIDFVRGRQLVSWLKRRGGNPVSKRAADDLLRRVEAFRAKALEAQVD